MINLNSILATYTEWGQKVPSPSLFGGRKAPTVIIKYPFWRMAYENSQSVYACLNCGEAYSPNEIADRSICINSDIGEILNQLQSV